MRRISSSATLGLKIFFPTFWIVFFGSFTIAVLISGIGKSSLIGSWMFKGGVFLFFMLGVAILYFTVLQLKRVEIDHEFVYVTNFFKTFRYPFHNVEKIVENNYVLFYSGAIHLKEGGHFGKKLVFIQSRQKFEDFVKSFPDLASKLVSEE